MAKFNHQATEMQQHLVLSSGQCWNKKKLLKGNQAILLYHCVTVVSTFTALMQWAEQ